MDNERFTVLDERCSKDSSAGFGRVTSFEGSRDSPRCQDCYLFRSCSGAKLNMRADSACYVAKTPTGCLELAFS